jgi:hypothetical protein
MDSATMVQLYEVNHKDYGYSRKPKITKADKLGVFWAGPSERLQLQAIYAVSMACLLRFDETLRIEEAMIETNLDTPGPVHWVKIQLDFRKTSQDGGMAALGDLGLTACSEILPFFLVFGEGQAIHMDAARALTEWLIARKRLLHTQSASTEGFVFRAFKAHDTYTVENRAMVRVSALPD